MAGFSGALFQSRASEFLKNQSVKKVVDYKLDNGKRFYKVKWECSWEPEENLLDYQNLVDQFWGFITRVASTDDCNTSHKRIKLSDEASSATTPGSVKHDEKNIGSSSTLISADSETNLDMLTRHAGEKITLTTVSDNARNRPAQDQFKQELTPVKNGSDELRPYKCPQCDLSFKRRDMFVRHGRTHTKEFCYFCVICGKGFIRRYVLTKHLSKEHQTNDEAYIHSTKRLRKDRRGKGVSTTGVHESGSGDSEIHDDIHEATMVAGLNDSNEDSAVVVVLEDAGVQMTDETELKNSGDMKVEESSIDQSDTVEGKNVRLVLQTSKESDDVDVMLVNNQNNVVENVQLKSFLTSEADNQGTNNMEGNPSCSALNTMGKQDILQKAVQAVLNVGSSTSDVPRETNLSTTITVYQQNEQGDGETFYVSETYNEETPPIDAEMNENRLGEEG